MKRTTKEIGLARPGPTNSALPAVIAEELRDFDEDLDGLANLAGKIAVATINPDDASALSELVHAGDAWLRDDRRVATLEALADVGELAQPVEVSRYLGELLVGTCPDHAAVSEPFVRMLHADVSEAKPSIGALVIASRRMRRTWRPEFGRKVPSIPEVLQAVRAAEGALAIAERVLERLPDQLADARAKLETYRTYRRAMEDLATGHKPARGGVKS